MIGNLELATWAQRAAWGIREWRLGMEHAAALAGCLAREDVLLPHIDVGAVADPLAGSGFTVPADEDARAERRSAGSRRVVAPGMPATGATRAPDTRTVTDAFSWPMPARIEPTAGTASATSERVSDLLTVLERIENSGAPEGLARRGSPERLALRADTAVAQRQQSATPLSAALSDHDVAPALQPAGSRALPQLGSPAYITSSLSRVTELLHDLTATPERRVQFQQFEAAATPLQSPPALFETTTNAAWTTLVESAASSANPDILIDAVERFTHTVETIGERFRSTAPAAPPCDNDPEIRWIADDDLAGRLHAILKRQAHARGIDLS